MRVQAVVAGGMASDTGTPWGLFGRLCESHEEVSILVLFLCVVVVVVVSGVCVMLHAML